MHMPAGNGRQTALVLAGGGARAAYQASVLEYIHELAPEARFPVITGASAGAINAAYMAGHALETGHSDWRTAGTALPAKMCLRWS
ncbi:MAG: patatin-like phospholipase family protein [Bacteroidota bacterium]|nr:patatin-like phospholipase family protein [Bacteroidota bacterium]